MTNEEITKRCQHCGGSIKEHGKRKPYMCSSRLTESKHYWEPWTLEAHAAAVKKGQEAAAKQSA